MVEFIIVGLCGVENLHIIITRKYRASGSKSRARRFKGKRTRKCTRYGNSNRASKVQSFLKEIPKLETLFLRMEGPFEEALAR